jgi:hypothetical protein
VVWGEEGTEVLVLKRSFEHMYSKPWQCTSACVIDRAMCVELVGRPFLKVRCCSHVRLLQPQVGLECLTVYLFV